MDEKVLNEFIKRVEESAYNYAIHKNEVWKNQLEIDKQALFKTIKRELAISYKKGFGTGKFDCASQLLKGEESSSKLIG